MLITTTVFAAENPCVVPHMGYFRIHAGATGLFGAFAHDHLIEAQTVIGCAMIDSKDSSHSSIKLDFPAASIQVMMDPKASAKDRTEIQKTMQTDVLRISEFPRETFESTVIERTDDFGHLRVHGNLTIRGKTQTVVIALRLTRLVDGTYRAAGEYKFNQTSFGIEPVQFAGGTIKVNDELQVEFELFLH